MLSDYRKWEWVRSDYRNREQVAASGVKLDLRGHTPQCFSRGAPAAFNAARVRTVSIASSTAPAPGQRRAGSLASMASTSSWQWAISAGSRGGGALTICQVSSSMESLV